MSLEEDEVSPVKSNMIINNIYIRYIHNRYAHMYVCISGRGKDGTYGATISYATQHKTVICNSMVYMNFKSTSQWRFYGGA